MYKKMCPYCGGMHVPGQCPMFMSPAMPMPPSYPVPLPTPLPGEVMGSEMQKMCAEMHHMMMQHTQMLHHISQTVDQIYGIVQSMQTGMAKG